MSRLFIGQTETGKTTKIKEVAKGIENKIIVLDFNNQYEDWVGNEITIDTVNPLLGKLDLSDTKALNAGYLDHSHSLYRMCRDILKEEPLYREAHDSKKEEIQGALDDLAKSYETRAANLSDEANAEYTESDEQFAAFEEKMAAVYEEAGLTKPSFSADIVD